MDNIDRKKQLVSGVNISLLAIFPHYYTCNFYWNTKAIKLDLEYFPLLYLWFILKEKRTRVSSF